MKLTKEEIDELEMLYFILKTKGRFPYEWANTVCLFNMNKIKERIKELESK